MSVYKQFKTDAKAEAEGIELDYGDFKIKITRAGASNQNYQRALERETKPFRRAIQNETMPGEQMLAILKKVYASSIVLGWEGVTDENEQPLPFSRENCLKLFNDLPDLFLDVKAQAENRSLFLADIRELEAKN